MDSCYKVVVRVDLYHADVHPEDVGLTVHVIIMFPQQDLRRGSNLVFKCQSYLSLIANMTYVRRDICTVLYCIVLYFTVLYCTILYYTVLYCTVLYWDILLYIRNVGEIGRQQRNKINNNPVLPQAE